jgi:Zn-dependent protease
LDAEILLRGIVWYVVFVFSATAHEAAHAWAARVGGDSTAYLGGQISLDPLPHIRREPFGMVLFPIITFLVNDFTWMFGWASAPYNLAWALRHPTKAAWMSLAGPAANLTIALVAGLLIRAGLAAGVFTFHGGALHELFAGDGLANGVAMILSLFFVLNAVLFFFNLIPIPPLDGAGAIGLLLPENVTRQLRMTFLQPGVAMMGMLIAFFFGGRLIWPAVMWSIGLLLA